MRCKKSLARAILGRSYGRVGMISVAFYKSNKIDGFRFERFRYGIIQTGGWRCFKDNSNVLVGGSLLNCIL